MKYQMSNEENISLAQKMTKVLSRQDNK